MTEAFFAGGAPLGTGVPGMGSPFTVPVAPGPFGLPALQPGTVGSPHAVYGGMPAQFPQFPGPGFASPASGFAPPAAGPVYGIPAPWIGVGPPVPGFGALSAFPGQDLPVALAAPALVASIALKRGQPMGPANDREIEEVVYDALEWLPGANEVEARCEGGRITLTGSVSNKRIKHDAGEIAWAIPSVTDVQNTLTITARRRGRPEREQESSPAAGRKA